MSLGKTEKKGIRFLLYLPGESSSLNIYTTILLEHRCLCGKSGILIVCIRGNGSLRSPDTILFIILLQFIVSHIKLVTKSI